MFRILHVIGQMNRGGAETLVMNVYRHIDRNQVQFDFAVHTDQLGHFDQEIVELGGRLFPQPNPSSAGFRAYGQALSATLQQHGPFAGVHSHVHHFSGYVLYVGQMARVPLRLAHSHTTDDGQGYSVPRKLYRRSMKYLIHRYATHLLGCSSAACEALFGSKCWKDPRLLLLPSAIDLALYDTLPSNRRSLRQKLSLPLDNPLLGHVGRFDQPKNQHFLVEVFVALLRELPIARLVLVGDGPLRSQIEDLIRSKGIEDYVYLLGTRKDVPDILAALDLFLFPSLHEGLGIALVEAQAAGAPCVVADTVPREADINIGLVQFVSLRAGMDRWVYAILNSLEMEIPDWPTRKRSLQIAGYDISHTAHLLQEIYTCEQ